MVRSNDSGEAPTSIQAVRTNFGKATAAVGSSSGEAVSPTEGVYLILEAGDLTFSDKVAPPSCKHQAEPYFTAIVDAATFVTLDDFVGPNPPKEPLSAGWAGAEPDAPRLELAGDFGCASDVRVM